jgi:hypothetical protein
MEQLKQSSTAPGEPTTPVEAIADFDYVTVVGCSNPSAFDSISPREVASNLWNGQNGDKVMFINQGIRQIREYPLAKPDDSVQRVFLIFTEDYSTPLLGEVKQIVEGRYGAKYRELASIADLVDFVAARRRKKRLIRQMDFYSHGVVMQVEFGYHTDKEESYRLREAQARMLDPKAFEWDAKICSYACRTGLGIDIGNKLGEDEDPQYEHSLAQLLADSADVEVHAFPRRSLYDQTYGTAEDRRVGAEVLVKKKQYKNAHDRYESELADYRRRAGNRKEIPGELPPKAPVRPYSKEQENLALHVESRERYEKDPAIKLPLDAYGAVRPVRSGMTPSGLPVGLKKFTPAAWNAK